MQAFRSHVVSWYTRDVIATHTNTNATLYDFIKVLDPVKLILIHSCFVRGPNYKMSQLFIHKKL